MQEVLVAFLLGGRPAQQQLHNLNILLSCTSYSHTCCQSTISHYNDSKGMTVAYRRIIFLLYNLLVTDLWHRDLEAQVARAVQRAQEPGLDICGGTSMHMRKCHRPIT